MKLYWTISIFAIVAALLFGIFAHRQDQRLAQLANPAPDSVQANSVPVVEVAPLVVPAPADGSVIEEDASDPVLRLVAATPALDSIPDPDEPVAIHRPEQETVEPDPEVRDEKRILPFVFHANASEKGLMLQGSVPTRAETVALYEAAIAAVGEGVVENHLKYSPETIHESWIEELPDFIQQFFAYTGDEAQLTIVDGKLHLIGDVASTSVKGGLIAMGRPFREGGLTLVEDLQVKPELADRLPTAPDTLPELQYGAGLADSETTDQKQSEETVLVALNDEAFPKLDLSPGEGSTRSVSTTEVAPKESGTEEPESSADAPVAETRENEIVEKVAAVVKSEPVFFGPDKEQEKTQETPDSRSENEETETGIMEEDVASVETEAPSETAEMVEREETEATVAATPKEKIPDDGKPLIFYFDTGSSAILSEDREKIDRAIQRAGRPRSIVYITAYADYRGGYELNRKLSLQRAENVRKAIFSGDIADQVTAEITAKGHSQSVKQDLGRREETDEALRRSRRVVVEVYHLK